MAVLFPWKDLQVVQPANDAVLGPPTAGEPGGVVVPAGQTVHIPVKATSPGGYPLRFQVDRAPVRGTATPTTDGLTYTAAPGQSGLDAVIAHATDGQVSSKPVTLFVYVVPSGGGGTDPLVYGLLAQRRHAAHRPGRRVVRVIVASYQARRLVIRVIHGRHVVARRSVKPSAGPATIVTLRFRGPHGHYHVSARPLGKGYAYGKALKKKVRL
jgi:hypothetical protein